MSKTWLGASMAETGKRVTTLSTFDGIGIGYLYEGVVYESLGNGFYANAKESPFPVIAYMDDNGKGYQNAVCYDRNEVSEDIRAHGIKI